MDILAGVYIYKFDGSAVKAGDPLFRIYSDNKTRLDFAVEYLNTHKECYVIE
jgi:thymidine phosphorylase